MEIDSVKSKSPMAAFCYTFNHLKAQTVRYAGDWEQRFQIWSAINCCTANRNRRYLSPRSQEQTTPSVYPQTCCYLDKKTSTNRPARCCTTETKQVVSGKHDNLVSLYFNKGYITTAKRLRSQLFFRTQAFYYLLSKVQVIWWRNSEDWDEKL